jgi:predicted DNA-binding transcriptional regulator AlpA
MSPKIQAKSPFMNAAEIATLFGVTVKSVHRWIEAGKFPGVFKMGSGETSAYLVPCKDVEAYKKERAQSKTERALRST